MKLISLFIGISLHPFVIVPGLIGGLFIRSHLWRAVFLVVCCVFFSAILKQGPQWVVARLLGYFGIAYLAYGIKKIVLMRQAAMAWERRRDNPDSYEGGLPQKGFFARTPAKRLGLLLLGGSFGVLLVDVMIWAATKNVSEKLWDFFSPSSFHGSLAWLCFASLILGILLFFGKGGKLAKWISTGSTDDN